MAGLPAALRGQTPQWPFEKRLEEFDILALLDDPTWNAVFNDDQR